MSDVGPGAAAGRWVVSRMTDTDGAPAGRAAAREDPPARGLARRAGAHLRWAAAALRRRRRWLRRAALALLYVPAAVILLLGALAAVALLGDLWRLGSAFSAPALSSVPDTYDRLALSAHVALVGGAYLALLCALVIVTVGCRGRGWWRLYLIPGLPLTAMTALLLVFAVVWCAAAFNSRLGWPPAVWDTLTALVLADAVMVAARVGGIGAGPLGTRRARLRGRLRTGRVPENAPVRVSRQTRPIPVVRFGPRITGVPMVESATPNLPAYASTPEAPEGLPTAEELRAAAESGPVVDEQQEGAGTAPTAGAA